MGETIDRFLPTADVRERHEVLVHAPAELVFDVAEHFELHSVPLIRAIFWMRAKLSEGGTSGRKGGWWRRRCH